MLVSSSPKGNLCIITFGLCQKVSTYELETTTTGQTMAKQEDAFITTRTLDETLLVGYSKAEPR